MYRVLDIVISFVAIMALSPLLVPIVIALRLTGEGEVFYLQQRIGRDGRVFSLIKFATMLKESPTMATGTVTLRDDPRILPFGKLLRKSKINELPQLLNILMGDMSIVGPRPQTKRCFEAFPPQFRATICSVRPGLSGIGSIVFRDEESILEAGSNSIEFYDSAIAPYKALLESKYVENAGARTYFAVIVATVWVVIFPNSQIVWRWFPWIPTPPETLTASLRR